MLLEPPLLDQLLRRDVARGEEHRRRDALRQQRPRGELALIPAIAAHQNQLLFAIS